MQLSRQALRLLAEHGAPADLIVATTKCRKCGQVVTHMLGDFVPWRQQVA